MKEKERRNELRLFTVAFTQKGRSKAGKKLLTKLLSRLGGKHSKKATRAGVSAEVKAGPLPHRAPSPTEIAWVEFMMYMPLPHVIRGIIWTKMSPRRSS